MEPSSLDRINRRTYASRGARRQYGGASGWLDAGERAALAHIADCVRGGSILDIGVGGGRTAPLLSQIASRYIGIDYTADLLELARRRFPGLDLREMDARTLEFPDASFDAVAFTFNGIDSVDLGGRLRIFHEVFRVLRPGGSFVFSSLNRDGPSFGESVWAGDIGWRGLLGAARHVRRAILGGWRRIRLHPIARTGRDMAVAPLAVHDFGVVAMFTSLHGQLKQLETSGFVVDAIFDDANGRQIDPASPEYRPHWYYYVARKPAAETTASLSEKIAAQ